MKALISIILVCFALSVSANNSASGSVVLRDMQVTEFTSSGSSKIEHCVFADSLTVNGSADIYHSKIKFGIINGSLTAHGVDAHALTVSGSASFTAKSDVAELRVTGALSIDNSYLNVVIVNGAVYGNGAYINKMTSTGDLHFIDSDLGKVFVNRGASKKEVVVIKLFGKTTVRHLTIDSPLTIIILDNESKKTFNKSVVTSNGKVEYK